LPPAKTGGFLLGRRLAPSLKVRNDSNKNYFMQKISLRKSEEIKGCALYRNLQLVRNIDGKFCCPNAKSFGIVPLGVEEMIHTKLMPV